MDMVSSRNVADIVNFFKKEIVKTHDQDYEQVCIFWFSNCAILQNNKKKNNNRVPNTDCI